MAVEVPLDPADDQAYELPGPLVIERRPRSPRREHRIHELEAENARLRAELAKARQTVSDQGWELDARREAYVPSTDGWARQ